jgi:AcrR family transcriptional regulator
MSLTGQTTTDTRIGQDVVMDAPARRPAHRPSRRGLIVAAAMEVVADTPVDSVTVADIAAAAKMTPAAIYYHYPSREAILLEGIQEVGQTYRAAVRRSVTEVRSGASIACVPHEVMAWAEETPGARAYFVSAAGMSSAVEAVLRQDRIYVVEQMRRAVKASRPGVKLAEASVLAVALLTVTETALASMLTRDRAHRGLSQARFRSEVEKLAERVVADH